MSPVGKQPKWPLEEIALLQGLIDKDAEALEKEFSKLRWKAERLASAYFPKSHEEAKRTEAVDFAFDKVMDWMLKLDAQGLSFVRHPRAYIMSIVHNGIVDFALKEKEQRLPIRNGIEKELAWIDESISPFGEDEEAQSTGWQVSYVKSAAALPRRKEVALHPVLRAFLDYLRVPGTPLYAQRFSTMSDKRRNQLRKDIRKEYSFTEDLFATMPLEARRKMERYFMGYKLVEIASDLDISKQAVSRVIADYLALWQWDRIRVAKVRRVWLIHALYEMRKIATKEWVRLHKDYSQKGYLRGRHDEEKAFLKQFCHKVASNPKTAAYFKDITEDDMFDLWDFAGFCMSCFSPHLR